jgi:hypothetical protein
MQALEDPAWPPAVRLHGAEAEVLVGLASGDSESARHSARRQAAFEQAAGWSASLAAIYLIRAALAAGRTHEAVRGGRAAVARLAGGRDLRAFAFARLTLATALLADGAAAEAGVLARDGWAQACLFGMQNWWADQLALLAAFEGRPHAAVRLVCHVDAVYEGTQDQRDILQANSAQHALRIAFEALGDDTVARLKAGGSALRDEDIAALAFGAADA